MRFMKLIVEKRVPYKHHQGNANDYAFIAF